MVSPSIERCDFACVQMHVGQKVHHAPIRWRDHLEGDSLFDDDVFFRHVVMKTFAARFDFGDFVDHINAFNHFAKYSVAPALA